MKILVTLLLFTASLFAQTWEPVKVETTAGFRGLSMVSHDVMWASGTKGTVIRTIDGGKTWSVIIVHDEKSPGAEKLDFRGIHAFDADNAFIMSAGPAEEGNARLYRTKDGGKSWSLIFEDKTKGVFFDSIAFWDRQHGIVLSDPVDNAFVLFTTDDGGAHWNRVPKSALPPALDKEGAFAASNQCIAVHGKNEAWFVTGGATVARVFHTAARGKTWTVAETPMKPQNASSGIFGISMRDGKHGIAVGGDYAHPSDSSLANVMTTIDGGKTWHEAALTQPIGRFFSSISFNRDGAPFIGGTTGILTSNAPISTWIQISGKSINAISAEGWAVGDKGTVLHQIR
jgi:photosystem II stability/assembly factor-like uncharacterized protein